MSVIASDILAKKSGWHEPEQLSAGDPLPDVDPHLHRPALRPLKVGLARRTNQVLCKFGLHGVFGPPSPFLYAGAEGLVCRFCCNLHGQSVGANPSRKIQDEGRMNAFRKMKRKKPICYDIYTFIIEIDM